MRTIHFKNGVTKEISQGDLESIISHQQEKSVRFEVFTDKDKIYLVINVEEIVFID